MSIFKIGLLVGFGIILFGAAIPNIVVNLRALKRMKEAEKKRLK
jgi:pilus assembly protein TadC